MINKIGPIFKDIPTPETPTEFFRLFFDDNLIQILATESTNYIIEITKDEALRKTNNTKHFFEERMRSKVYPNDIRAFLSIIMIMGIKGYPRIHSHWSNACEYKDDFVIKVMSSSKFNTLNRAFHLTSNSTMDKSDPFAKISPFVNYLNERFEKFYCPEQELTIDESLIAFRGRVRFLFYIPSKPKRYGIKIHSLVESKSAYCLKILFDPGKAGKIKNEDEKIIKPENIIYELTKNYLNKYYKIYTDSWYTSLPVFRKLLKNKTFCSGMVNINRKYLDKRVIEKTQEKIKTASCKDILHINFFDLRTKKHLNLLTTCHSAKMMIVQNRNSFREVPECLDYYTKHMRGVDKMNAHIEPYQYKHSTMKWWKRVFFSLLEITLYNAYILFIKVKKANMKFLEFKWKIAKGILEGINIVTKEVLGKKASIPGLDPNQPIINIANIHNIQKYKTNRQKDCRNCSKRKIKRVRTQYYCVECGISLCPPCHNQYHRKHIYNKF